MQVREVMTRGVECVSPETSLQEAARKMQALDVGPLPVCDHDRLVGMVTDRDIVIRAVAEGRAPSTTPVREAMTGGIDYCFEDDDLDTAAKQMQDRQIRRLVVLDRNKRLVGIVSLGDVAIETGGDARLAGKTLEHVSEPARPAGAGAGR